MDRTETVQERHARLAAEIAAARARLERHEVDSIGVGDVMVALSHELNEIVHRHRHDEEARHSAYDRVETRLRQAEIRSGDRKSP